MSGLTLAKYVLALGGVLIVLVADRYAVPFLGWVGLGLILAAFFLRFWRSTNAPGRDGTAPPE